MNFRKKVKQDDLEINFIPLIDVLLVIIIFLVVSTTFSKFSELKINLPTAEANQVAGGEGVPEEAAEEAAEAAAAELEGDNAWLKAD